jgi:GDP-mannose pyrophosphatase NudK
MSNRVRNQTTEVLSDHWYTLNKITYDFLNNKGEWQTLTREAYDRGNGAAVLLYNKAAKTVILTRQFRIPTYVNGNASGMMIEVAAGQLDKEAPEEAICREAEEETGYKVKEVKKVFEAYMSPGSVTEILYFFIAEYSKDMKISEGGGAEGEHEDIEVLELHFDEAYEMIGTGEIRDAKTIMLLQYAKLHHLV